MHVAATAQVHAGPYRDIPVALATALSSQGNVAPTAHSRTLRLPCRLHKARGYALVRPRAPGHFRYGPGRGGRGGMARAPDRGGLRVAGPGLVSRPQRQARHGALPSKPPSVTTTPSRRPTPGPFKPHSARRAGRPRRPPSCFWLVSSRCPQGAARALTTHQAGGGGSSPLRGAATSPWSSSCAHTAPTGDGATARPSAPPLPSPQNRH